jgi:hypothetical protein
MRLLFNKYYTGLGRITALFLETKSISLVIGQRQLAHTLRWGPASAAAGSAPNLLPASYSCVNICIAPSATFLANCALFALFRT